MATQKKKTTTKKKTATKRGRPTKITPSVLDKLRECFIMDFTDAEACMSVGISVDLLYKYQREHPEFINEKQYLKADTKRRAKININNAINRGDSDLSKWYLEKRDDDFNPRKKHEIGDTTDWKKKLEEAEAFEDD